MAGGIGRRPAVCKDCRSGYMKFTLDKRGGSRYCPKCVRRRRDNKLNRRIIVMRVSGGGKKLFGISFPPSMIERYNLRQGGTLEIVPCGDHMLLRPKKAG